MKNPVKVFLVNIGKCTLSHSFPTTMAIPVMELQNGDTKLERFLPENQHTQRKLLNFEFWINGELSKIRHHFSNILSYALKLVFFNEKKLRKIRMIFDIENWL